ncbi:MAG: hypothetical protein ABI377_03385, partial [Devosia sp.]
MLAGLLYSEAGNRMIPVHATKGARRYRYYVEERSSAAAVSNSPFEPIRLPATEIEAAATSAMRMLLGDQRQVLHHLDDLAADQKAALPKRLQQLLGALNNGPGSGARQLFRSLVTKITYRRDTLGLEVSLVAFRNVLGVGQPDPSWPQNSSSPDEHFIVTAPLIYRRRGVQAKLVVDSGAPDRRPDRPLQQAVARAHAWFESLASGKRRSVAEIATAESITGSKVTALLQLAFLSPELVDHIVRGTQPISLSAEQLIRGEEIPMRWSAQQRRFSD